MLTLLYKNGSKPLSQIHATLLWIGSGRTSATTPTSSTHRRRMTPRSGPSAALTSTTATLPDSYRRSSACWRISRFSTSTRPGLRDETEEIREFEAAVRARRE
nr:hypothetical protein Iba_chr02bCG7870 [Ipomoea batatas]